MGVQYLVDYENVHEAGLCGMEKLTDEDRVYIFHTCVGDRISLSVLEDVRAGVKVIRVPGGNQSLDMHLGSFLGYLIGKEDGETRFAVVSCDADYRNIADFWNRTCGMPDKVRCVRGIGNYTGTAGPDQRAEPSADDDAYRADLREYVLRIFSSHAETDPGGMPRMPVSDLCNRLNALPAYNREKSRLGLKSMRYLEMECGDILEIRREWNQNWAYLLAAQAGDPYMPVTENVPADAVPAVAPVPEEDTAAGAPENAFTEETGFLSAALEYLRAADESVRNADGSVRASGLRDRLLTVPGFRKALRESGMKPIPFMQQLFGDSIEIRREKGVFLAFETVRAAGSGPDGERKVYRAQSALRPRVRPG